jgi:glyoxylase I family protein
VLSTAHRFPSPEEDPLKIEHFAFIVADPVAMARWYEEHLGLRTVRSGDAPAHARFLADSDGTSVLEVYTGNLTTPAYSRMDPLLLHVAFETDDVALTRDRLIAAGATAVGDVTVTPSGDTLAMLRDPWGLAIQLACRNTRLVS